MTGVRGSVIIPAYNEERGIARTLDALAPAAEAGVEVIVVPNGCRDDTAGVAKARPWAKVIVLSEGSKQAALNAGDAAATGWPRVYLDADLGLDPTVIPALIQALTDGDRPSGRPAYVNDTAECSAPVRAYYRARDRMPSMHRHLWGAGCYALTEEGRARFDAFPLDEADDAWVDGLFAPEEKLIVPGHPIRVRQPRTIRALLHTLPRVYHGKTEGSSAGDPSRLGELLRTVRGPASALDALVYLLVAVAGKAMAVAARRGGWRRDESSRA